MARYQHLPVFQSVYDFILELHKRVEKFPRAHRYSIGEKIKNTSFILLDLIIEANSEKEKAEILKKAIETLEKLKIYVRLCFDLKIMGTKGFEYLARCLDEISRQLAKWYEWSLKK